MNKRAYTRLSGKTFKINGFSWQNLLPSVTGSYAISLAIKVLDGQYEVEGNPEQATMELFGQIARTKSSSGGAAIKGIISGEEWSDGWRRQKEEISSSFSGLHFGHYKSGSFSPTISHLHVMKSSVAFRNGTPLERWKSGLAVMLEKQANCMLVDKLRSILLMEADFNFCNKALFGKHMMERVRTVGHMADEIFSDKNRTAEEGSMTKILFYNVLRQTRKTGTICSVDAENCYNRVAHAIVLLTFQSYGIPLTAAKTVLTAIQEMKFYLPRTAFGDSKDFAGATLEIKTQGLCQGNGAAPAGWAVASITILSAHKRKGHGAKLVFPLSSSVR